jgi:hypothetical protein
VCVVSRVSVRLVVCRRAEVDSGRVPRRLPIEEVLLEIRLRAGSRSRMCEILALQQRFGDMFWPIRAVARIPDISKWDEVDGRDVGAE